LKVYRPTRKEVSAAAGKGVPDVIAPGLRVLFVGINPSLYSAAVGHHFARPGNRFWPALHRSGFTQRLFSPFEGRELLRAGCGITNFVSRATAAAADLTRSEIIDGGHRLQAKVRRYRPYCIAVLGIEAYRTAFGQSRAATGPQPHALDNTMVWLLPNPSGLNASYQLADLARLFRALRVTIEPGRGRARHCNPSRRPRS